MEIGHARRGEKSATPIITGLANMSNQRLVILAISALLVMGGLFAFPSMPAARPALIVSKCRADRIVPPMIRVDDEELRSRNPVDGLNCLEAAARYARPGRSTNSDFPTTA
jgi:hypothetical protein